MSNDRRNHLVLAYCAIAVIVSLYLVGIESHGIIRHIVQTAPLWIGVWLGWRNSELTKWALLPCFTLWLVLMANIWFLLLGLPHFLSGDFTPIEILLTVIIGVACIVGVVRGIGEGTSVTASRAFAATTVLLILQLVCLRVSFLPRVSRDPWYHPQPRHAAEHVGRGGEQGTQSPPRHVLHRHRAGSELYLAHEFEIERLR